MHPHRFLMGLLHWHKLYKRGEDELPTPPSGLNQKQLISRIQVVINQQKQTVYNKCRNV